jgi:hypothetical protein
MDDLAPVRLRLNIAAFRAIAAAVTEAEIGGQVPSVTISQVKPDLQLMAGAVAVELTIVGGTGRSTRRETWIVADDGRVVAREEDPARDAGQDRGRDAEADSPQDADED